MCTYQTKQYRAQFAVKPLIKYLEWMELVKNEENYNRRFLDEIVNSVLPYFFKNNVRIFKQPYIKSTIISYTLCEKTFDDIEDVSKKYQLSKGEVLEACLYLYAILNFSSNDLKVNRIDAWKLKATLIK